MPLRAVVPSKRRVPSRGPAFKRVLSLVSFCGFYSDQWDAFFSTRVLAAKAHLVGGGGLLRGVGVSLGMAPSAGSRLGGGQPGDLGWT